MSRLVAITVQVVSACCALSSVRAEDSAGVASAPASEVDRVQALEAEVARQAAELAAIRAQLESPAQPAEQPAVEAQVTLGEANGEAAAAALLAEAETATELESIDEPSLRLYGFADVGLQRIWTAPSLLALAPESQALTFVLGNVNLYLDAAVSKNWRFLAEIRFFLGPNGASPRPGGGFGPGSAIDTTVTDPGAANGSFSYVRWAGVVPQRAHIDWTPSDAFNLRAGLFLTPYGIWNVDHGTPTRIMASEPLFLSTQLMPNQLVGVEAYGTLPVLPWTIGYHLHVSNGRTVGQVDLSDNKALGGRLFASTRAPYPMKFGVSSYWGTSESQNRTLSTRTTISAFTEYALSADASLDLGPLRVRSELVTSWTLYDEGKRPLVLGSKAADNMRLGSYLMLAYQLPWYALEPLLMFEYLRLPFPRTVPVGRGLVAPSAGVNVYFTATTMLRTQFAVAHGVDFGDNPVHSNGFLYQGAARLITAF